MRTSTRLPQLAAVMAICGLIFAGAPVPLAAQSVTAAAEPRDAPDPPARVGRIATVRGAVSFHGSSDSEWSVAAPNYPIAAGHALWTEPGAGATIDISASRIALAGGTGFDLVALDDDGLRATLSQGKAYVRLRANSPSEAWSVQTLRGTVTFSGNGRYLLAAGLAASPTLVTVLDGAAHVTGPGVDIRVKAGQTASLTGTDEVVATIAPARRDAFLDGMLARDRVPARPLPAGVAALPGGGDLAAQGVWGQSPDYGPVWYPDASPGWVPYRDGHWAYAAPWGWTWIDDAPWGFAPFHYGRWAEIDGIWAWAPGVAMGVQARPVYAPAVVTFFGWAPGGGPPRPGRTGAGSAVAHQPVAWCPLGPREPYRPWYPASDRYLRAINSGHMPQANRTPETLLNHRAATMVAADVLQGSGPVRPDAQPLGGPELASARPATGGPPVSPTLATAGMTAAVGRSMHLHPVPGAPVHAAPGPPIRVQAAPPAQFPQRQQAGGVNNGASGQVAPRPSDGAGSPLSQGGLDLSRLLAAGLAALGPPAGARAPQPLAPSGTPPAATPPPATPPPAGTLSSGASPRSLAIPNSGAPQGRDVRPAGAPMRPSASGGPGGSGVAGQLRQPGQIAAPSAFQQARSGPRWPGAGLAAALQTRPDSREPVAPHAHFGLEQPIARGPPAVPSQIQPAQPAQVRPVPAMQPAPAPMAHIGPVAPQARAASPLRSQRPGQP